MLRPHGTISTNLDFWPSFVDVLATVLMVLTLQSFLQSTLNEDSIEASRIRREQDRLTHVLTQAFAEETRAETLTIIRKPNLLQIRFAEGILFDSGDHRLKPAGTHVLRRCAQALARDSVAEYRQIQVEGHTDDTPKRAFTYPRNNWELSTARALTVVQTLIANGLTPRLLSANGYGEFWPLVPNKSTETRALNRRIELRIVFTTPGDEGRERR